MDWLVRRPVAVIGGAFVMGASVEAMLPEKPIVIVASSLLSALSFLCALFLRSQHLLWAALCSCALGLTLTRCRLPPMPQDLEPPFEGVVATSPTLTSNGYRMLLKVGSAFAQLRITPKEGTVGFPKWQIGDTVLVRDCWIRAANQRRFRFQRIFWIGWAKEEAIERLKNDTGSFSLSRWRERWRKFVFERWRMSLPEGERTFTISALASIVFGMRTAAFNEEDEKAFARSGLAHLFVPSGSQVSLLMGLAWFANRISNLPPFPLLVFLLGFYLPLTTGEPSIFRAVLMGIYAFFGWKWWRDVDWQTALWLSSALLVAIAPEMLHDAGFQFSCAATFGLIYTTPMFLKLLRWLPVWLRFPIAGTLSAQIFLTPLLSHYFGRISLVAPIANLCAVVPASFSLALGFLSALLSQLSPLAAMPLSFVAGEMSRLVVRMAYWFSAPSWASIRVRHLSGWEVLVTLTSLTIFVAWMNHANGKPPGESQKFARPQRGDDQTC